VDTMMTIFLAPFEQIGNDFLYCFLFHLRTITSP
jgi:hypothetical protein